MRGTSTSTLGEGLHRRTSVRIGMVSCFANVDGAVFVFVFFWFIAPTQRTTGGSFISDLVLFVAFMVFAVIVMSRRLDGLIHRTLEWLADGRPPTVDERSSTLALPFRVAVEPLSIWVLAAVVFALDSLRFGHDWRWALVIAGTVLLGGVVSAAVAFLFMERISRPVFAAALAGEPPDRRYTIGVRPRLLLTWALGSAVPLLVLAALPLDARFADERTNISGAVVAVALLGLLLGLMATAVAAMSLADPLHEVRDALARVQSGDLGVEIEVNDGGEVGLLQSGVNQMVAGLRERQRLADLFGRHVGAEVAQQAIEQGTGIDSEQRDASVLFVDLIGSTALAEVLSPQEVVRTLNAYFDAVVRVVSSEGGWVNKFEGDGALCVFGAPATQPDHAARALRAARTLHRAQRVVLAVSRYRCCDRCVLGSGRGRQRRHRAALRVHGDRPARE